MAWMKRNAHQIVLADTDKHLGDGLSPRAWIDSQTEHWLSKSFSRQTPQEFELHMRKGKFEFLDLLYRFRSVIPRNKLKFMTHELEFKRAGCFRLRPKVHKPVLGSRPVSNLRTSWAQRPCAWLCCVLQPTPPRHAYIASRILRNQAPPLDRATNMSYKSSSHTFLHKHTKGCIAYTV